MKGLILSVWAYRAFVVDSIRNSLRARFVRSRFGALWGIFHPLAQVAVFFLILSHALGSRLPGIDSDFGYAIYLCAGMLGWQLFAETLSRCTTLFIDQGNLIKKVAFPRITLLFIVAGETLLNNLFLLASVLGVFVMAGHWPGFSLLWLAPLVALNLLLSMSLGMTLGLLNVFMRDIGQVVQISLTFLFWLTPVVYLPSVLPENLRGWLSLNPLFDLVSAYHEVLVFQRMPDLLFLGVLLLLGLLLTVVFFRLYARAQADMVDLL